jgi:hypothetical protein
LKVHMRIHTGTLKFSKDYVKQIYVIFSIVCMKEDPVASHKGK